MFFYLIFSLSKYLFIIFCLWFSTLLFPFSDPEKITGMTLEILTIVLGSLPQGYQSVYNKIVGITDIILGKVLNILNCMSCFFYNYIKYVVVNS